MNSDLQPDVTGIEFLSEVMHSQSMPLNQRIDAAAKILSIVEKKPLPDPVPITIEVRGFPSIELMKDLLWIKWCFDHGISDPDMSKWDMRCLRQ